MIRLILLTMAAGCGYRDPLLPAAAEEEDEEEPPVVVVQVVETRQCTPAAVSLPAVADTYLSEQYPDQPQGGRPDMFLGGQAGARCWPLVQFDLSALHGGEILGATLHATTINVGVPFSVWRVGGGSAWDEAVTWGDMMVAPLPWVDLPDSVDGLTATGRTSVDLPPSWVDEWRSGAHADRGVMLRTSYATGFNSISAREGGDPPALEVRYLDCGQLPLY